MSKYGAKRTTVDGIAFDSKAEARRYGELAMMQRAGVIAGLECHPRFDLVVNGVKVCRYEADFRYVDDCDQLVVEDVKGGAGGRATMTAAFRIKAKLMKAIHGIEIRIVEG